MGMSRMHLRPRAEVHPGRRGAFSGSFVSRR